MKGRPWRVEKVLGRRITRRAGKVDSARILELAVRRARGTRQLSVWPWAVAGSVLLGWWLTVPVRAQTAAPSSAAATSAARAAPPAASTGDKISSAQDHKIRVRVEVVNVPVTALDKRGLPVIDLTEKDFQSE